MHINRIGWQWYMVAHGSWILNGLGRHLRRWPSARVLIISTWGKHERSSYISTARQSHSQAEFPESVLLEDGQLPIEHRHSWALTAVKMVDLGTERMPRRTIPMIKMGQGLDDTQTDQARGLLAAVGVRQAWGSKAVGPPSVPG